MIDPTRIIDHLVQAYVEGRTGSPVKIIAATIAASKKE